MPLEARLLTGLALSLLVVFWVTPVAIRAADRFEFYDKPVGYKGHAAPTPYLGGAAVVAGFAAALLLLAGDWTRTVPLVVGVFVLWAVGTLDDRRTVTPPVRVAVELILAGGVFALGQGWDLGSAPLSLVVTMLWVVAVVNAFNLFDNMDGATSTMAAVVAAAVAVLGVVEGDRWLAVASIALCGACIGFLPHNLASPARIFLGDGGSMPVGFAVAVLVMSGTAAAAPEGQALAMGLVLVGIPALDTCLVVVSRTRRGIPLLTGGRDHLTHRTRQRLRTARAVAIALGAAQAMLSALALVAISGGSKAIVAAVAVYLVGIGVAIAVLDSRGAPAPSVPPPAGPLPVADAAGTAAARVPGGARRDWSVVPAVVLGLGIGVSPFFFGYYDTDLWVPIGLGLVVVATAASIAAPRQLPRAAVVAVGGLAALALWALASAAWAHSSAQAVVEANRMLVYAVFLGLMVLIVPVRGLALWVLAGVAAVAVALALTTLVALFGDAPDRYFLSGRLNDPLGYVNGQANYYLLAAWICIGAAVQRRSAALAGAGAGFATLLLGIGALSYSRGFALAAIVSAVVVIALVPGRVRHAWALLAIAAGLVVALPPALDLLPSLRDGALVPEAARAAGTGVLTGAVVSGVVWGVAVAVVRGRLAVSLRPVVIGVLLAGTIVCLGIGVAKSSAIVERVETQYRAFVTLGAGATAESGAARLVSGGGNRYDYWRVAGKAFAERPVIGVGAGNYDVTYFRERVTQEDIRQPHSLQLQTLGELGLVGAVLLVVILGGVATGARRTMAAARISQTSRALAVGTVGITAAWLAHVSVDWIHLLPGVTAIALVAAAFLVGGGSRPAPTARRPRLLPAALVAVVLAVTGIGLARAGLVDHYRDQAQDALDANPATALEQADRALRLDPASIQTYYVKAAALARFGEGGAARSTLLQAARREPRDFLTWALLGDLAVRERDFEQARRYYSRALRLNPLDPILGQLAADPRTAAGGGAG